MEYERGWIAWGPDSSRLKTETLASGISLKLFTDAETAIEL